MGFLKTILIILLVYYSLKILAKYFAPKLFNYAAKKAENHFKEKFDDFSNQHTQPTNNEGDVTIERTTKKANSSKKVGDYIDFEEID